ncbi:1-aminocyclopropane-1-carboxylate synthase-like protein 1 [Colletotrichum shisoi]|uniref:1-aminocyclopropane-1-carboxylate synthase-like protein 1 n=1 Tax=Colletotrichum shisoi TaxID=2078593 RepID=A0A5Q4BRD8_9PEZI|nr:1-aminocyclopropane-1-carboxylate synthase-like protein 1 [Colletotrichum shisoi]
MSIENALPPSCRGQKGIRSDAMTDLRKRLEENPYDLEKNPKGIIDLGSAVNELMLDDLSGWTKRNIKKGQLKSTPGCKNQQDHPSLSKIAADLMNEHFRVRFPLTSDNILAANGVTTLLDNLIYNITNEGDTILIPTPSYGMFAQDVWTRNGVRVVEVRCDDIHEERFRAPPPQDDSPVRTPEVVRRLEVAIEDDELSRKGRVGGVVLVNPDNPLCARHRIHLIVDEIYAISAGDRFSSVLSLGLDANFRNVHVLWGLSKDFGLSDLRVGFLATYNAQVYEATRALTMFGQVSSFSATAAATLLSDTKYLRNHYLLSFRRRLDKRRTMVEETLDNYEIPHVKPEAGFFVFVDLFKWVELYLQKHGKGGDLVFLEYLMKQRVFLEPGQALFSQRTGWFRLNFGGEKESFKLGLQRLLHCLRSLDGQEHHESFTQAPELYFPPPKAMAHFLAV